MWKVVFTEAEWFTNQNPINVGLFTFLQRADARCRINFPKKQKLCFYLVPIDIFF